VSWRNARSASWTTTATGSSSAAASAHPVWAARCRACPGSRTSGSSTSTPRGATRGCCWSRWSRTCCTGTPCRRSSSRKRRGSPPASRLRRGAAGTTTSTSPGPVAEAARRLVLRELGAAPAAEEPTRPSLPDAVVGLFVTVYADGRLIGCAGAFGDDCGDRLPEFVSAAVHDRRFRGRRSPRLHRGQRLPALRPARDRPGVAGLGRGPDPVRRAGAPVRQRDRAGFVLPFVAVTHEPDTAAVRARGRSTRQGSPGRPTSGRATTAPPGSPTGPRYGGCGVRCPRARRRTPRPSARPARAAAARYTLRHSVPPDEPYLARYEVFADRLHAGAHAARIAYGAWVKARAGMRREAEDDLARAELDPIPGWIAARSPSRRSSSWRDWRWEGTGGRRTVATIAVGSTDRPARATGPTPSVPGLRARPGAARPRHRGPRRRRRPGRGGRRALRHYRRRFRQNTAWGGVSWLPQAYAAWGRCSGRRAHPLRLRGRRPGAAVPVAEVRRLPQRPPERCAGRDDGALPGGDRRRARSCPPGRRPRP
jgi:hypothetical protein